MSILLGGDQVPQAHYQCGIYMSKRSFVLVRDFRPRRRQATDSVAALIFSPGSSESTLQDFGTLVFYGQFVTAFNCRNIDTLDTPVIKFSLFVSFYFDDIE